MSVDLAQQIALQLFPLGGALLDEIRLPHGFGKRRGKAKLADGRRGRQGEPPLRACCILQRRADAPLRIGMRIMDHDIEAVEKEARGPSRTDDAGTDDGAAFDGAAFDGAHGALDAAAPRSLSLRRTSAGVRTRMFIAARMATARSTRSPFEAFTPLDT